MKSSDLETRRILDVFGPTVEFLTSPSQEGAVYCVMKGTVPAGVTVPMHSHSDDESFFRLSGAVQVLTPVGDHFAWSDVQSGGFVHVIGGVKHAWRNILREPAVQLVTTTARLGRFFLEVGRPVTPGKPAAPPTPEEIQRFAQVAAKYGHWLGDPSENAAVGISLFQ